MGVTTKKYDILTRIAVGNGALVYRAVDKETTRQVALKLLVQDGDLDHRFNVDALLADAKKLTQITGAHVCHLLDAHTDEDGPVLIYEFADGITGTELPPKRKLEGPHALDVAAQLLSALRSGERQRCPHGDLKPSNIVFVDLPDGRLFTLVLDWGLAAHRTALPDDSLPFLPRNGWPEARRRTAQIFFPQVRSFSSSSPGSSSSPAPPARNFAQRGSVRAPRFSPKCGPTCRRSSCSGCAASSNSPRKSDRPPPWTRPPLSRH